MLNKDWLLTHVAKSKELDHIFCYIGGDILDFSQDQKVSIEFLADENPSLQTYTIDAEKNIHLINSNQTLGQITTLSNSVLMLQDTNCILVYASLVPTQTTMSLKLLTKQLAKGNWLFQTANNNASFKIKFTNRIKKFSWMKNYKLPSNSSDIPKLKICTALDLPYYDLKMSGSWLLVEYKGSYILDFKASFTSLRTRCLLTEVSPSKIKGTCWKNGIQNGFELSPLPN